MKEVVNPLSTIWFRCNTCNSSYFIKSDDKNKNLLQKSMRCPNYVRCDGKITKRSWNNVSEIRKYHWVTAIELYQAAAGLGLVSERDCSPGTIKRLLTGNRVLAIELQDSSDPKKSILMSLTLETGKIIHLASSVYGAIVYKVTEIF